MTVHGHGQALLYARKITNADQQIDCVRLNKRTYSRLILGHANMLKLAKKQNTKYNKFSQHNTAKKVCMWQDHFVKIAPLPQPGNSSH